MSRTIIYDQDDPRVVAIRQVCEFLDNTTLDHKDSVMVCLNAAAVMLARFFTGDVQAFAEAQVDTICQVVEEYRKVNPNEDPSRPAKFDA